MVKKQRKRTSTMNKCDKSSIWTPFTRRLQLRRDDAAKLLEIKSTNLKLCPDVMIHEDIQVAQKPEALSTFFDDFEEGSFKIASPTNFGSDRYYLPFPVL